MASNPSQEENNNLNPYKLDESHPLICDLTSNASLNYVSQILLEDNIDEKIFYQEEDALRATEKSFYELLGQEYPSSSTQNTDLGNNIDDNSCKTPMESIIDSQFRKGVQEAMKFLPSVGKLSINSEQISDSRSKMISNNRDLELEETKVGKRIAFYLEEPLRNETFDEVLLLRKKEYVGEISHLREIMQKEFGENNDNSPIDIRPLLINCSQAIANNDHVISNELIKKIRENSSPNGNYYQRLAHYFLDGLEARLAGTGSEIYRKIVSKKPTTTNFLKAFRIYLAACPYMRASFYFCNQTILNISKNASKIHIIDFGIHYGFQWPSVLETISTWRNTIPKIKITGIDFPLPGFRPAQLVEEAGKRLSDYAKSFNIDFHYQGIASKWENIKIEDLNIEKDEIVIVNCLFRSEFLIDESNIVNNPRDSVLNTIRKLKPSIFIHGIINCMFNSPYFVTRFREALFHYSSFFDMFDSNMPQYSEGRFLMEKHLLGPKAVNVIACEGSERVVRPENYKQWQTRSTRVGFEQILMDQEIYKAIKDYVKKLHHKEFVVDEDNNWLLMGWKGRISFALSTWKSKEV